MSIRKTAVLATIMVPILLLVGCGKSMDSPVANAPASSSVPTTSETTAEGTGDAPGARVGSTQRSWPDELGNRIDEAHTQPGQYSVDILGRPVWTPNNDQGDLPNEGALERQANPERCAPPMPQLDGKTQIQYLNGRYLVVNDKYGPSRLEEGVPVGYSPDPFGAVIAAMNQMGYGLYAQGDEIGYKIDEKLWSTSQTAADERAFLQQDRRPPSENARALMVPAAAGVRFQACSESVATIDVAIQAGPEEPYVVARVPMIWKEGDWRADFTGIADDQMNQADVTSLDSFETVTYQ
ncbi:hypothetical protein [Corynebacterium mayonis]|uniref:hypothetical protein n=1 Tax=Corynebacterium mayonis TaxID=3062461 RepID=UPI00313FFDAB